MLSKTSCFNGGREIGGTRSRVSFYRDSPPLLSRTRD